MTVVVFLVILEHGNSKFKREMNLGTKDSKCVLQYCKPFINCDKREALFTIKL